MVTGQSECCCCVLELSLKERLILREVQLHLHVKDCIHVDASSKDPLMSLRTNERLFPSVCTRAINISGD